VARPARARRYVVTARVGPKVERDAYEDIESALSAMHARAAELSSRADARPVEPKLMRRFEPVQQVVARIELAGPERLRAGIDVRGDGSTEGFTGRLRRRVVEQREGESSADALRRTLRSG
jgi:hypothetical protein